MKVHMWLYFMMNGQMNPSLGVLLDNVEKKLSFDGMMEITTANGNHQGKGTMENIYHGLIMLGRAVSYLIFKYWILLRHLNFKAI